MIGESLLASPLYGNDYATATKRDVYLPEGKWIDFETGQSFEGPLTLQDYSFPPEKIPVFVGGKGVLVTREHTDSSFIATVYPVQAGDFDYTFYYPDRLAERSVGKEC